MTGDVVVAGRAGTRVRRLGAVRPGLVLALAFLAVLLVSAIVPRWVAPYDPAEIDFGHVLAPPSPAHPFGTDLSGRDLLSRVIAGAGASLGIGLGAVALALVLAVVLGVAAAASPRVSRVLANRAIDVLFAFPMVLLGLLIAATYGPGLGTLIAAVGIGIAPGYSRIVRGQVLAVRGAPYVEAATALGHGKWRILLVHVAPNALRPLVITATLGIGQAVIWASGLAFLGLGVPPPAPEWGALLDAGRTYLTVAWWLEIFPGAVVVLTALAFTVAGRHLAARLHPESR